MKESLTMDALPSATGEMFDGQKEKARKLRKRLHSGDTFMLPEAWDVATARLLADAGHEVIGVSTPAIAWARGLQPEERVEIEDLLAVVGRITRGFQTPVIADFEGVLGRTSDDIRDATEKAIAFGCVGVTFSDGGRNGQHGMAPAEHMAACIKAAKAAAAEAKIPVVIGASTEAFLLGPRGQSPFETAVERSEVYFAAGADCVLAPGLQQVQIIERLVGVVDGPIGISLNVMPAPDFKSLAKAGVACVGLGSVLFRSLMGLLRIKAEELLAFGHFATLERAIPETQLKTLLR